MNNLQTLITTSTPYAIIEKDEKVSIMQGQLHELDTLEELEQLQKNTKQKVVFILPFCLARSEKQYDVIGEEKIIAMQVETQLDLHRENVLNILPDQDINIGEIQASISDKDFIKLVDRFKQEIYNGNICQGVLSRRFDAQLKLDDDTIISIFKKLLTMRGQYMTYLFDTPENSYLGASPEKHLSIENSRVTMNPIAGTLAKMDQGSFGERLIDFLSDTKEKDELAMVIDEELKMMLKIADNGIIEGPMMKEAGSVIHTEVILEGKIKPEIGIIDALRETLYAPTLVGGPIESAFGLISQYEQETRGYYGAAFGILDEYTLDSCIVIRSAVISKIDSTMSVRSGAGIVKDSVAEKEMQETIKKSQGFLGSLTNTANNNIDYLAGLDQKDRIKSDEILTQRHNDLSSFYSHNNQGLDYGVDEIQGKTFVLVHNGDDFVFMIRLMIEKMGAKVDIIPNEHFHSCLSQAYDVVLLGPGYGDINNQDDDKMRNLLQVTRELIEKENKLLGICLGHQAISKVQGQSVDVQDDLSQGENHDVLIHGETRNLAFYNSFSPLSVNNNSQDIQKGKFQNRNIYQNNHHISSIQAHPESVMSKDGFKVLRNMILEVL